MRFVEVPIQNMQKCNSAYNNKISEGMLCAGFEEGGKDSCQVIIRKILIYNYSFF